MNVSWLTCQLIALVLALPPARPAPPAPAHRSQQLALPHHAMRDTLPNLSVAEAQRVRQIVMMALNADSTLTPAVRREFWRLVNRVGPAQTAGEEVRDRTVGFAVSYERHLYRDALAALEHRGPTKSPERAAYEQRLRTLHLLAESRTKEADEFVLKIAAGDSVQVGGHSVLLTAERLQGALASLDQAESRLDQLFARP